jgi:DNA-binding NarL/FixJ family response regulator
VQQRQPKIDILLVEDDRLMFEGLAILLGDEPDLRVVGVATSGAEAVEKAQLLKPDVVLIDYHLPDGDGTEPSDRIRTLLPDTAILFLSADATESALQRAVDAGASGYLSKAATTDELTASIRRAADGEFLLEAATVARLTEQKRRSQLRPSQQTRRAQRLTGMEREVLLQMAAGLENWQIAGALNIGQAAVRGHVHRILGKLGSHSKVQALAAARQSGLLET